MLSSEGQRNGRPAVAPGELNVVVSGTETDYELRLLGELDMSTAAQLQDELLRVTSGGPATSPST